MILLKYVQPVRSSRICYCFDGFNNMEQLVGQGEISPFLFWIERAEEFLFERGHPVPLILQGPPTAKDRWA